MDFEWDKNKDRSNKVKHGLSFGVAIRVFDDPFALYEFNSTVEDEYRFQVTGAIGGSVVVVVVYTVKERKSDGKETYRVISGRRASPSERERYAETAH